MQSLERLHVTPSATPENKNRELIGLSPISRSFVASCVHLQLRPLPSTGVTRLHQYYEPLRHPSQPGLPLASCQLIHTAITAGTSRVAHGPLCLVGSRTGAKLHRLSLSVAPRFLWECLTSGL
jgi:hypothetical protein